MTNRLRKNNALNWYGVKKGVQIGPNTGRAGGRERNNSGGGGGNKNRRKQWYEGLPKLKDGKYTSQKFSHRFQDLDYTYPVNTAL